MTDQDRHVHVEELCHALNLSNFVDAISPGWEESEKSMPDHIPDFLNPDVLTSLCHDFGIQDEMRETLVETARLIARDPLLTRLAWHAYWLGFGDVDRRRSLGRWPSLQDNPRFPGGNSLYVIVSIGALPKLRQAHEARGIPRDVADFTLVRIVRIIDRYRQRHGTYGMPVSSFSYFCIFFNGELFHIGRLQFHYNPFGGSLRAYRHISDGAVIALSEPDVTYRADGEFYLESRGDSPEGVWTADLDESDEFITGNPISPIGKCSPETITLAKAEWTCVLRPKDHVIQMHIPRGDNLDIDECGRALQDAAEFFTRYFPDRSFKAFAINTWLMDHQLEDMLSEQSNLVRFQKQMYRFPTRGTTQSALHWIFGSAPKDLTQAPRDTTLRRRVLDHVLSGQNMVGGGGFILADDINAWGTQVYRRQDPGALFGVI